MLVVQKYGGSSVANAKRIKHVAQRVAQTRLAGHDTVVVVSAMGDTTDELIELAYSLTGDPSPRELDVLLSTGEIVSSTLLAMAIRQAGCEAISLSGPQAGIKTDRTYSKARILAVEPERIAREIKAGRVVIVAGFQGITPDLDIATLGRGGSDTTAVALAAALKAQTCEIYTDVDGVFTADPRVAPEARQLKDISYEEMLELAQQGARVMHPRAVELGWVNDVPILVASSFHDRPGTLIHGGTLMEDRNKVRGIAHDADVGKVTLLGVPDRPGIAAALFEPLAEAAISIDTIVQNAGVENLTDLSFTVSRKDLGKAMKLVEPIAAEIGARGCLTDTTKGKVSIVGSGMQSAPGYAARMFRALHEAGININMISTSEIRITCIVDEAQIPEAVRALHRAFQLQEAEASATHAAVN